MTPEDCFWIFELQLNRVIAVCTKCSKLPKYGNKGGMFWEGSKVGYGEYDLDCEECGKTLHINEAYDNENEKDQAPIQD